MMKKLLDIIILLAFWSILFSPLYFFSKGMGIRATACIAALYLLFLLVSLSYKYLWSFQTFHNLQGTFKFFLLSFALFLVLLYMTNLFYIAHNVHTYLTEGNRDTLKDIEYKTDKILGFKPVPNIRTLHTFKINDDKIPRPKISIAYDDHGFRIPLVNASRIGTSHKADLLFLGDSFTLGAACNAEDTFPFLVSKGTNLSYINAGVSSYSLAHMLILAETLIPQYQPDYVIVQYSPWLASRSISVYAPIDSLPLPVPFFAKVNDHYTVHPPLYMGNLEGVDTKIVKSSYNKKFIQFLFKVAVPFSLREIWYYLKSKFLFITGQIPRPATNLEDVERYAYNRIKHVAEKHHATVIILNLGDLDYSKYSHGLFSDGNIYFAEADYYLNDYVKNSPSKDYCMEFCHWVVHGKNLVLIDRHPNPKAHRLIANSIMQTIKRINDLKVVKK